MSRDSLRPGVMEPRGGSFPGPPPLRPRPGFLDVGGALHAGPAPFSGPAPFPGPPPDLHTPMTPSMDMSSCGGGTNGAVPTLTTPTLTPTTLRNIEQMFGEADPHEPPLHHENAAGFVPPIISPTSGNSYVPLGLGGDSLAQNASRNAVSPPPLMMSHDKDMTDMTSLQGTGKMREDLQSASPRLSRPHTLQLGQFGLNGSSSLPDQSKVDLINKFVKAAATFKTSLPGLTQVPSSASSATFKTSLPGLTQVPSSASTSYVNSFIPRTAVKEEFLQSSEQEEDIEEELESSPPPSFNCPPQQLLPFEGGQKKRQGGRKPATSTGLPPEEELKRVQRRERNKQAAARCRKRRLDQTVTLQVEVDSWEEKRRILKEEIQQLETQKKGLEMVLGRHHGSCKVKTKPETNNLNKK